MNDPRGSITLLLDLAQGGDRNAADELHRRVEAELRKFVGKLGSLNQIRDLADFTDIVNDVFVNVVREPSVSWQGRKHFFRVAAKATRNVFIDYLRKSQRLRTGGRARRVSLGEQDVADHRQNDLNFVELHDAIEKLASFDAGLAEIADLHLFAGRTLEEVGEILGMPKASAVRRWITARAWLRGELAHDAH